MRAERLALLCATAVLGCARTDIEEPRPTSVEPASGYAGTPTPVLIRGDGFLVRTTQSTAGGEPTVDAHHRAWLGETELDDVMWIDVHTLHAIVPAGLPQGLQPLVVENAYGRRGSLQGAYAVVTSTGAMLRTIVDDGGAITVSVGQVIALTATVTNVGTAAATGLAASATATSEDGAAATLTSGSSPPEVTSLGPGQNVGFQWTYTALAAGQLRFSVSVTATDDFSGVEVGSAADLPLTIELPASIAATIVSSRTIADTGQAIALTFTVTNGGSATAHILSVVPAVTPSAGATCGAFGPAPPLDVGSGQAVVFRWTCTSGSAGSLTLGGAAHATDANSGDPIEATAIPAHVTVQTPAALTTALAVGGNPVTVSVGQSLTMTLTVTNGGGAGAQVTAVTPTVSPPGSAACGAAAPAPPQPLAGGQARTFTWTCTPAVAGNLTLGATVAGNDVNTGEPLTAAASLGTPLTVQLPAALAATVAASFATGSVGQAITVNLTVTNGGSAAANLLQVTPSVGGTSAASCGAVTPATPVVIASGQATAFSWTCTPTSVGNLQLSATVSGTDANSGTALSATPGTPAAVTVQNAAALAVTAFTANRTTANVSQAVGLTLTVTNIGGATANLSAVARTVSPSATATCTAASPAPPRTIAGGASQTFTWSCTATSAGTYTLGATVSATDANSGAPANATGSGIPITVQTPAALGVTAFTASRTTANVGQAIGVTLTLSNTGGATANVSAVTPTVSPSATGSCTAASPAPPRAIAGGASQTFTWSCTATSAGGYTLGATIAATDANSGAALAPTPSAIVVTVQTPALLSVTTFTASRTTAAVGQAVGLTLTLANTGGATASVSSVTPTVSPPATVSCTAASPAPPRTIAGSASQTFTWSCTATSAGGYTLGATIAATDTNSGAALGATPSAIAVTVQTPAALAVTTFTASRTTAAVGQAVGLTLTVANTGGAPANVSAVAPSVSPSATASCTTASPAPPRTIAAGTSQSFTWSCTATTAGTYTLGATVSATDANSGAPANATASGIPITVQTPAALGVTAFTASRTTANVGQAIGVTLTLSNTGGATANVSAVTPTVSPSATGSCTAASPAPPRAIAGGASQTFTWSCTATSAGGYTLGATIAATDANSGAALAPTPSAIVVTVQTPALLSVTAFTASGTAANVGQAVGLTLTLSNTGGATANVSAVAGSETPAANASCMAASPVPPQSIAGGASLTFTWSCTATATGSYTLRASITASDANSGAALNPAPAGIVVSIQLQAALAATTFSATPTSATVGAAIAVTLTLASTGGASVNVSAVTPSASPTSAASCAAPSPAPPRTIAGGASLTFTWACTAAAAGSATLQAVVSATDANTGADVSPVLTGIPVTIAAAAPASLAGATRGEVAFVLADAMGDGTPATFVNAYQGGAWVGPSRDGKRFVRLDPVKGSAAVSAELALRVDAGPTPASNGAWIASATATTLGYRGCATGTTACGPDDEAGGALVCTGELGGQEYLMLSGVAAAGSRYLYATTSGASPLEATWVDLYTALDSATGPMLTAAAFASDRVYLGYARRGSGPLVLALLTAPLAGLDAKPGTDVVDVGAPATAAVAGVNALASLDGVLYVAHDGGIVRASTTAPTAPGDWAPSTPTALAWSAKSPVPPSGVPGSAPRDRTLPALAAFGACGNGPCIFAARNVLGSGAQPTVVPQLWRCAPTAGPARCDPGDWALATPNASGDTILTQLGDDTNEAASVLVATPRWLYVGFDNRRTGVQLFRASGVPMTVSDFKGRNGCAAGTPGCEGIGGNGFGDRTVTGIFDAKVLTFAGVPSLWLTAGDGTGPVRIYRVEE